MADLRIVDAPLLSTVKGTEKIPTGGEGNFSVSVNQVADFAKLKWFLATEGYVDNTVGNVQADLNLHKNNESNPHNVTKTQVGLGNVDNTADLDKPVSNATQSAIITANSGKADKSYVDSQDQLKADKGTVETSLLLKADKVYVDSQLVLKANEVDVDSSLLTKADKTYVDDQLTLKSDKTYVDAALVSKADKTYVDSQDLALQTQINQKATAEYLNTALTEQTQTVNTALSNLSTVASKFYPTLAEANADIANLAVNQVVNIGEVANGGLWYKATAGATSLTKSAYDPLSLANDFTKYTHLAAVTVPNNANLPSFNTATKQLVIPAGIIIQNYSGNYATPSAYDNTFAEDGDYRIYYNTYTTTYRTVKGGGGVLGQKNEFLIATARISSINSIVTMTCDVSYNNQLSLDLTRTLCEVTNSSVDTTNNLKTYPFYNTTNQSLTFFNDTVFSVANYSYTLTADTAIAKPAGAGTVWKIFLNVTNNTFVAKAISYQPTLNERKSWALVAIIRDAKVYNARNRVSISMNSDYFVDGKINEYPYVESVDTISELIIIPIYNGQKVLVKQYRTESVGKGGGLWEWSPTTTTEQNYIDILRSARTSTGRWIKAVQNNTVTAYDIGLIEGEGVGLSEPNVYAQYWTNFLQVNRKYKCVGLYGETIFDPSAFRDNKIEVEAHRGFYSYFPENTMLAFSSAKESGADVLEVDVQMTSDGVLVCYHDLTLDTLTDLSGKIDEKTYADVVLAKFKSLTTTRFYYSVKIPKLSDLLDFAKSKGIRVNIECNTYNYTADDVKVKATTDALIALIVSKNMENQVMISSFTLTNLIYMRTVNKNIRLGYLNNALADNTALATAARWCCMIGNAVLQVDKDSAAPSLSIYNKYVVPIQIWTSMKNNDVKARIAQGFTTIIADNARGK